MEPSPQIPGVHVNVNDHYDADRRDEKIQNASEVTDILAGEWESSYSRSEKYAKDIMGAL
jgi:ABC-type lipoprotein release transport system permease subunit